MKKITKKIQSDKGIAIITVLSVSFILLALGTILMINCYYHLGVAKKYYYDTEALDVAEAGVSMSIYYLEQFDNLGDLATNINPNGSDLPSDYNKSVGDGTYQVKIVNNITGSGSRTVLGKKIPPYSILITSTGQLNNGVKKTVETLVNYQLIPHALISEGKINLDPNSEGNDFQLQVNAIKGFTGDVHTNYKDPMMGDSFTCGSVPSILNLAGGTISTAGYLNDINLKQKINDGGARLITEAPAKKVLQTSYSALYDRANRASTFIDLDQHIPFLYKFKGKLRKTSGGHLEAWIEAIGLYTAWRPAEHVLPDNMSWNDDTGTLEIQSNTNYKWDGDLELDGVNIKIIGKESSGLFATGSITGKNIDIEANSFALVSDKDITLDQANVNITASIENDGVAIYAKDFIFKTKPDKVPSGGNMFKGIVYTKNGQIVITNECTIPDPNNILTLEGLIINTADPNTSGDTTGVTIKNKGSNNFKVKLTYNPYLARFIVNNNETPVELQPVYWKIY